MLNKDLINPSDREIVRLKMTIDAFKKYDKERKEYISNLEHTIQDLQYLYEDKCAEYKELFDSINEDSVLDKYIAKIEKLELKLQNIKESNLSLNKKCNLMNHAEEYTELFKQLDAHPDIYNVFNLRKEITNLKKQNSNLIKENKNLVYKIIQYEKKENETSEET